MSHGTDRSRGRWQPRIAWRAGASEDAVDHFAQFDVAAWVEMLAEQRLLIATAAGVDPSRVTIQVGH
jgi:hypothetical protein